MDPPVEFDQFSWLHGSIDVHIHAAPSLFPRWGDAAAVADACRSAGMTGVLLKAHEGSTTEVAATVSRTHAPFRVAGGLVLNRYVGGINPAAVEVALALGARCIWLPTIDSDDHVRAYGATGGFPQQRGGLAGTEAITVLDPEGHALPDVRDVLALARDHNVAVATGHIGASAIVAVAELCRDLGLQRLLLQHPCFATPALGMAAIEHAASLGAYVELTYLSVSPMWMDTTLDRCVQILSRVNPDLTIISSDSGQRHTPSPPEALRSFAQTLYERGVPAERVQRSLKANPARLLGW